MTCAKCGAELNASAKFCPSCGSPTAVPAPSSSNAAASAGGSGASLLAEAMPEAASSPQPPSNLLLIDMPAKDAAPNPNPKSMVNPFAVTASPGKRPSSKPPPGAAASIRPPAEPKIESKVESQPPPKSEGGAPPSPRAVSPLAVSNGISGPTPFQEAVEKARQSVAPSAPGSPLAGKKSAKKPGTYVMPNAPLRPGKPGSEPPPSVAKEEEAAPAKKKPVAKTVAMAPIPPSPRSQHQPAPGSVAPGAMPQSVGMPRSQHQPAPGSVAPGAVPQSVGVPPGSFVAPSQQPSTAAPWMQAPPSHGYQPQPAAQPLAPYPPAPAPQYPAPQWGQAPPGYGYPQAPPGYAPGARVQVTWSNGQRYPATVSQVNGPQCLVRFPDGQQHWVDMQYLTPG